MRGSLVYAIIGLVLGLGLGFIFIIAATIGEVFGGDDLLPTFAIWLLGYVAAIVGFVGGLGGMRWSPTLLVVGGAVQVLGTVGSIFAGLEPQALVFAASGVLFVVAGILGFREPAGEPKGRQF